MWKRMSTKTKRNVGGMLVLCEECDPPWVGTPADSFQWDLQDDACPQCRNTDLKDVLSELEPEEYLQELLRAEKV